ncbi:hypothetical protein ARMSODRAFT_447913 [Armillaria solidipes]|uniref:Uncharacterized protein n=1 Tax=Armillaria solidipes TaxID=1076256 RepID=A0A2H3B2W2_9AGAR|nr:hypothetical protein ARMSODRAFT_447913 [Armillaria solidipes]
MMAYPKSMMTGESRKMTFHTVLRLEGMEHVHHSAGDCHSFLLVDDDTGLEILHVYAITVFENQSLDMRWRGSGSDVMDRRTTPWSENHISVHQSPPVLSIPIYASLLEGASALVEEESTAALIDMVRVIGCLKGRWTSIDHLLSSNHLNTSCPNPLPVVVPFISNVIRRLAAKLDQLNIRTYTDFINKLDRAFLNPTLKGCAQAKLETLRQGERPAQEVFIKMPDGTTA